MRNAPSVNGVELAKVNVGQTFDVLEEQSGWVKIKVSDTITGWVSSMYVQAL